MPMPAMADQESTYRPRDTLSRTLTVGFQTGLGGTLFAATRATLTRQNVGIMGTFTQGGHIIGSFLLAGVAYQFGKDASSNLRSREDCWSEAIGGFMAGTAAALPKRSLAMMLGAGSAFATIMSVQRYTRGIKPNEEAYSPDDLDVDRKEEEKMRRRRPILETIEELGEGRGIYAPGYAERRRQRLLEKYGVDVKAAEESS